MNHMKHRLIWLLLAGMFLLGACTNATGQTPLANDNTTATSEAEFPTADPALSFDPARPPKPSAAGSPAPIPDAERPVKPTTPADVLPTPETTLRLPDGFRAEVYAEKLRKPTAMTFGFDGRLYLTQINEGENDGAGQVVRVAFPGAQPEVLLDNLFKPTGLAWSGEELFIATGQNIVRTRLNGADTLEPPKILIRDLPYNGRSNGQMTLLPDRRLLFEASGSINDPNSGVLLVFDPVSGDEPAVLARGLKGAYAHAVDRESGTIYTTEIGDNPVNGQQPPEEINRVRVGADYGWPRCYGNQQVAENYGGTAELCAQTEPPVVTLPPRSTPTGLAYYDRGDFPAPYRDALYVALWNADQPEVWHVALEQQGEQLRGTAAPFMGDLQRPIDVLPDLKAGLLVLDYEAGTVYQVTAQD